MANDHLPGTICRHRLGPLVRILGQPAVATARDRVRCEIIDPGPTRLRTRQQATFRTDWLVAT